MRTLVRPAEPLPDFAGSICIAPPGGRRPARRGAPSHGRRDASGACALSATKALYCWGSDRPLPTLSNSTLRFTSISGLAGQLCAIDTDGIGYCGSASGLTSLSPTLRFKSLASGAGFEDRCGIAEDGYAYCSGNNDAGEAGTGALAIYLHDTYFPDMRRVVGQ